MAFQSFLYGSKVFKVRLINLLCISMVDLQTRLDFLRDKYEELTNSNKLQFIDLIDTTTWRTKHIKDTPMIKKLESAGCYVIYEVENPIAPIYVGVAGKNHGVRNRINDLFFSSKSFNFYHSLTEKLIKEFGDIQKVRKFYLDKCYLKVVYVNNDSEAIALEGFLILTLDPLRNKETLKELDHFKNRPL